MSRILIALELGGNYGHLAVCLPIAKALRARGHAVAFALRDLRLAAEWLAPAGFPFIQSPVPLKTARLSRPPANYAEILLGEGYGDVDGLSGLVGAWRNAFRLAQADLIVADHAPTALFAARLAAIPHVALGSGFTVPPAQSPLPSIRPWEDIPKSRLERSGRVADERLFRVAAKLGCTYHAGLSGLFGTNDLLTTFEELDCYAPRSGGRYIGPIYALPDTSSVVWPSSTGSRILVYMRPDVPGLPELLTALAAGDAAVLCVIPGAKPELSRQFAGTKLQIVPQPVNLQELLAQADLVVSYGGHGFLCEALQAGRPLLIVPQFVEQALNARGVERLGAGIAIGADRSREVFGGALARILGDPGFTERARTFAERHALHTPGRSVVLAVEAIEAVLNDKHPAGNYTFQSP
ncbi:MAG TPA: nucleotide disphospho-sugar-binding domain-containing protein [Azonexus sp.]|nr:nucleotide disphospho-sugar-binding domain-containing protein [Azonexus sp.]